MESAWFNKLCWTCEKGFVIVCLKMRYTTPIYIGEVSIMGVPQSGWFRTDNPFKTYELGYPPFEFRKAPNMAMFFSGKCWFDHWMASRAMVFSRAVKTYESIGIISSSHPISIHFQPSEKLQNRRTTKWQYDETFVTTVVQCSAKMVCWMRHTRLSVTPLLGYVSM